MIKIGHIGDQLIKVKGQVHACGISSAHSKKIHIKNNFHPVKPKADITRKEAVVKPHIEKSYLLNKDIIKHGESISIPMETVP